MVIRIARSVRHLCRINAAAILLCLSLVGCGGAEEDEAADGGRAAETAEAPDTTWAPDGVVVTNHEIPLSGGWITQAQLTAPDSEGPHPVVVLIHGSGPNDLNETLPGPDGEPVEFFRPIAGHLSENGIAVLRYNKRGVVGVGPQVTDDENQLRPDDPDTVYTRDAADVAQFATTLPEVDPARVFLLGHSEGTLHAANIAGGHITASDGTTPDLAGVVAMGVLGLPFDQILYYQLVQRNVDYLATIDTDDDGLVTVDELDATPPEIRSQFVSGDGIVPAIDSDADNAIDLERELRPFLVSVTGMDAYPDVALPDLPDLIRSIQANGTVTERLPPYEGPVLLLNGRNDFQTTAENAEVAEAALAAADHPDHTLLLYDGLGHTFNATGLYEGAFGRPDERVLDDLTTWIRARAGLEGGS